MPSQQNPKTRVTVGKPQIQPQVTVGQPQIEPRPQISVDVGMPTLGEALSTVSVGAPAAPGGGTPSVASLPFSTFYAMTRGNPALAEKLCPGVTAPDGYKVMVPGQDSQVHVPIAPEAQQTAQQLLSNPAVRTKAQEAANRGKIDQIFAQSAANRRQTDKGGTSGQQWIDTQTLAQQLGLQDESALTAQMLASIYPGIDKPNGKYPWVHADPDRPRDLVINPQWKGFAQYRDSVGRRPDTEPGAQSYDGDM